jgi:hypothetical protein
MRETRLCLLTLLVSSAVLSCTVAAAPRSEGMSAMEKMAEWRKPGLKVTHDEFTGQSSAHTPFMKVGKDLELVVVGSKGKVQDQLVWLISQSDDWKYLRCHNLYWLADGKPIVAPAPSHDGKVHRGGVSEDIEQTLSDAEFLKMATAKQVRGRICNTEFQLTPAQIGEVRSLAAWMGLIRPSASISPSPPASPQR